MNKTRCLHFFAGKQHRVMTKATKVIKIKFYRENFFAITKNERQK